MKLLRTPDTAFASLPDHPFAPNYVDVRDGEGHTARMHYVDEGPRDGRVVLMMHGEPTWSFLYRKVISHVVAAGHRAVAPDLIGFGRSDKPSERSDHTYARHVAWVWSFLEQTGLRDVTLLCQDWGSLVGLRVLAEHAERFAAVVLGNGGLPTGDQKLSDAFFAWRQFSQEVDVFPVGGIVGRGCATTPSDDVIAAYDAPFPEEAFKAGARQFPVLVPASPEDPAAAANRAAWEVLKRWEKPFVTAFSDSDAITRGGERPFQNLVPGARGQPHTTIRRAGHFLQEDQGEALARVVIDLLGRTSAE